MTEDNGFVTDCEARFLPVDNSPNTYVLVWACSEGVDPPSGEEEEQICQYLFEKGLVGSCSTPTGVTVANPRPEERTQLPSIKYVVYLKCSSFKNSIYRTIKVLF